MALLWGALTARTVVDTGSVHAILSKIVFSPACVGGFRLVTRAEAPVLVDASSKRLWMLGFSDMHLGADLHTAKARIFIVDGLLTEALLGEEDMCASKFIILITDASPRRCVENSSGRGTRIEAI